MDFLPLHRLIGRIFRRRRNYGRGIAERARGVEDGLFVALLSHPCFEAGAHLAHAFRVRGIGVEVVEFHGGAFDPAKVTLPPKFVDTPETRDFCARYCTSVTKDDTELGAMLDRAKQHFDPANTLLI